MNPLSVPPYTPALQDRLEKPQITMQTTEAVPLVFISIFSLAFRLQHFMSFWTKNLRYMYIIGHVKLWLATIWIRKDLIEIIFLIINHFCNSLLVKSTEVSSLNDTLLGKNCIQVLLQHTATQIHTTTKLVSFMTSKFGPHNRSKSKMTSCNLAWNINLDTTC